MFIEVGGLLGLVGGTEVRSAFSGTLEGVLVLAGERVTRGQPVAWLRAPVRNEQVSTSAAANDQPRHEELFRVETVQDERTA
jgi:pyruvate/2-oxoglutarate dehydrogenase complex dihydrolipoamide acyltransferase (E2) component